MHDVQANGVPLRTLRVELSPGLALKKKGTMRFRAIEDGSFIGTFETDSKGAGKIVAFDRISSSTGAGWQYNVLLFQCKRTGLVRLAACLVKVDMLEGHAR